MLAYYHVGEQNRTLCGVPFELMVNAMADVKPGFVEWEWR